MNSKIEERIEEIDERELEERVNLLRRFRQMLIEQKKRFISYLELLDREEEAIMNEDMDKLEKQVEIEKGIVEEITDFQRVIDPLDAMYRELSSKDDDYIPRLKTSLQRMKQKVLQRNKRNQMLLKEKMGELRKEIESLKIKKDAPSPFANIGVPTLIDITT